MAEIDLSAVRLIGSGLSRPECVIAHSSGLLFAPDWTEPGGVSAIAPNGGVRRILATRPDPGVDLPIRPNGIALEEGGTFLIAHLGAETGGIYRLHVDGRCQVVTDRVDGEPMRPANFVALDRRGRMWITISTRKSPRATDYRPSADTGHIALFDGQSTRMVADRLGYANECLLAPDGRTLWVNETFGRRLTAFDVVDDALSNKRVVATFGAGVFPDGLALGADGALFVVSIVSNRVFRLPAGGEMQLLLEEADADHVDAVETAFNARKMGREHLDRTPAGRLRNISNIAFGGPDFRTAFLGCLLGDAIAAFESPYAGARPPWWNADLGPLSV